LIRLIPLVLKMPIAQEGHALPLLHSYMMNETAVNKSAWSCRLNGARGRVPAVSQAWRNKLAVLV